jgi:WD40 repeat protein
VAFSSDGQSLAAGSYDGTVHVWSMRDGTERLTLKAASDTTADTITSVAFSADGQWLVAGAQSLQNSVQFWRLDTGKLAGAYPGQYVPGDSSFANSLNFSPDGQQLAVATLNRGVWLISAANHSLNGTLATAGSDKTDVAVAAFSRDNQYVVAATTSGALQVWRLSDKKLLRTLREHSQGIQQVAFSPDGQYLATGSFDGAVRLWRVADLVK